MEVMRELFAIASLSWISLGRTKSLCPPLLHFVAFTYFTALRNIHTYIHCTVISASDAQLYPVYKSNIFFNFKESSHLLN
jgi:hypothetical protein